MSYDIRIRVKAEGCDCYPVVAIPEYDSPTYNLGKLFRACMNWDFNQGDYYKCDIVIDKVENGLKELYTNHKNYIDLLPSNGWGTLDNAINVLESLRKCIYELDIPLDCIYMNW